MLVSPQSRKLHLLLRRLSLQMLVTPQSLQVLLSRLCWQMLAPPNPPQSLQVLLRRFNSMLADARASSVLANALMWLCWQMPMPPQSVQVLHWWLSLHLHNRLDEPVLCLCLPLSPYMAFAALIPFPASSPPSSFSPCICPLLAARCVATTTRRQRPYHARRPRHQVHTHLRSGHSPREG